MSTFEREVLNFADFVGLGSILQHITVIVRGNRIKMSLFSK